MSTPNVHDHLQKVGEQLELARPSAAVEAYALAVEELGDELDNDGLSQQFMLPVAMQAVEAGNLSLAFKAAQAADFLASTEETRKVLREVDAMIEALEYGEFVSPERLGTSWWSAGPELLPETEEMGRPLKRWLAARVDGVSDDQLSLHCADLLLSEADPDERPARIWTTLPLDSLQRLSPDELPASLLGAILEVGIYSDGETDGRPLVRVVTSSGGGAC